MGKLACLLVSEVEGVGRQEPFRRMGGFSARLRCFRRVEVRVKDCLAIRVWSFVFRASAKCFYRRE